MRFLLRISAKSNDQSPGFAGGFFRYFVELYNGVQNTFLIV
nr:MAG TPA: hypothetical protein [Caudoviricetes sp.]